MNLVLVAPEEVGADGVCTLSDARAEHVRTFLHAEPGRTFRVGVLDGLVGEAVVREVSSAGVTFSMDCREAALPPWYDLVLALTRPRSLRRILFQSAAMGVRNIFLVGAEKVEKSYFSMHLLREEVYRPVLIEGLMQGRTTAVPRVRVVPKLRALWELLPPEQTLRLIANPSPEQPPMPVSGGIPLIAVGPDGGWTPAEICAFEQQGFQAVSLGERPLRTDTAAVALPMVVQALRCRR